jgi:hypothetical protein
LKADATLRWLIFLKSEPDIFRIKRDHFRKCCF